MKNITRHLSKPAYIEAFKGGPEVLATIDICKDTSLDLTSKLPLETNFGKISIVLICFVIVSSNCFASEPLPWQVTFQPPASPIMEELHHFHNFLLYISTAIVLFVAGLLGFVCIRFNAKNNPVPAKFSHNILIEIIWTVIPIIILVIIAVPSFRILRHAEKIPETDLTIKVVGYQWYWHYIYPDHDNLEFDSVMISDENLKPDQKRLLDVDNRIIIPENATVRFLITAGDVIHSFAVPSLGFKIDAVPGRINETWTRVAKKGVYYGQCSELCGINHGFMPIAIEVVSKEDFDSWIASKNKKSMNSEKPKLAAN
ncbi:Cytochrome c oxidase polypeptide II [Rickettsia akari str. Hartford]|uniref:Cytochrome c oxidase subunit 2 n=1 Tax=Rickettsia akari (strain Hartford) TaxID=293614 RepID=A8GNC1_RICAH|nr:cytochrome c oxidase subunit II [Rickettsia akari]ABV74896.1 Cytochrome c oxidase polypeptide II [Rickettsia akari str. Hartford]